jgi:hypothetical protein
LPSPTSLQRATGAATLLEIAATLQRSATLHQQAAERHPRNPYWRAMAAKRRVQAADHLACAEALEAPYS